MARRNLADVSAACGGVCEVGVVGRSFEANGREVGVQAAVARVLGLPVRADRDEVGWVTAVVASPSERPLGLEVTAPGRRLFLPWAAASLRDGIVLAASWLVLFDADEVEGYVRRGARLLRDAEDVERLSFADGAARS